MPRFIPVLVLALAVVGTPVLTAGQTESWRWEAAFVDATREYLELRYGSSDEGAWDDSIVVARVGRPVNRVFPVQFVLPDDECEGAEAREAVGRSLDYYLVELGKSDPWEYAIHHTMTVANMYSRVHWGWIRPGSTSDVPSTGSSASRLWGRTTPRRGTTRASVRRRPSSSLDRRAD
jgi:hypothetical protein